MDSDDLDWDDVPLTRTSETGHLPANIKILLISPTVGVSDAELVIRVNETSDILSYPNSHDYFYAKENNIISILQMISVECCMIASYSMLITEYLKANSDVTILPIIWPVLKRTGYLIDRRLSNTLGIDIPTFLENINST